MANASGEREFYDKIGMARWGWLPVKLRSGLKELHDKRIVSTHELRTIGKQFAALEPHRDLIVKHIIAKALELHSAGKHRNAIEHLLTHTASKDALDDYLNPVRISFECTGATHKGMKRSSNDDVCLIHPEKQLFVIADGMGGHANGRKAASTAVAALSNHFDPKKPGTLLEGAHEAHQAVFEKNEETQREIEREERRGVHYTGQAKQMAMMGTTLTALHIGKDGKAHIAHVGDTRVYHLRKGALRHQLTQLTTDHSVPGKQNQLTQAIGGGHGIEPEYKTVQAKNGDVFFLCSDGINKHIMDKEIKLVLTNYARGKITHTDVIRSLIKETNRRGGTDNSTALVVKVKMPKK